MYENDWILIWSPLHSLNKKDGLIIVGVILLILWILCLAGVIDFATSGFEHIFIVLATIFIIAWIFARKSARFSFLRRFNSAWVPYLKVNEM